MERKHSALGEKEAAARAEVERLLAQQVSAEEAGKVDKEVADLRAQLRAAKAEATKHEVAAEAAREEANDTKAEYKEVLRSLKDKYRDAKAECARLAGVEVSSWISYNREAGMGADWAGGA